MHVASLAVALIAAAQGTDEIQGEIVGYQYSCSATVPVGNTSLSGSVTLEEDGALQSFFAQYDGERGEIDQLFFLEDWAELKRRNIAAHLRMSLVWRGDNLRLDQQSWAPRFEDASLRIDVSTRRRLPKEIFLVLSNGQYGGTGLVTSSHRWPGRKTGAAFGFPLREVLTFKSSADQLQWRLITPPLPVEWSYNSRRLRAEGWFDPAAARVAEKPFAEFVRQLQAKRADFRTMCERSPVYYDPLSEI